MIAIFQQKRIGWHHWYWISIRESDFTDVETCSKIGNAHFLALCIVIFAGHHSTRVKCIPTAYTTWGYFKFPNRINSSAHDKKFILSEKIVNGKCQENSTHKISISNGWNRYMYMLYLIKQFISNVIISILAGNTYPILIDVIL